MQKSKRGRRSKIEIYYDILYLINNTEREFRLTHLQLAIKTSYDKFTSYLNELEMRKLIRLDPFVITEKGKNFLTDYEKLMQYLSS